MRTANVPTPPREVSHRLEYSDKGISDKVPSRVQRNLNVGCISHRTVYPGLTIPLDSLVPLMITRLILSLKKTTESTFDLGGTGQFESEMIARHTIGGTARGGGGIALRHLSRGSP